MRPEKARQIINNTIQRYMNDEPTAIYIPDMKRALNKMYMKQVLWHEKNGYDFAEMYDPENIAPYGNVEGEMFYISDRWNNPTRLQWLITGIDENKF